MAVNVAQLANSLRITSPSAEETEILTRTLATSDAIVDVYSTTTTPETVKDEAIIRLASYLYDQPTSPAGIQYAAAARNSGALTLLAPYQSLRAEGVAGTGSQSTPQTTGGLERDEILGLISNWAEEGNTEQIPANKLENAPAGTGGGLTSNQVKDLISNWAETDNSDLIPASKFPAPTTNDRGGVKSITNALIDAGTSTAIFGWAISHVKRVVNSILPEPTKANAGRVLSIGSNGSLFYDLARDVLIRSLGSLSGQKGKVVGINNAEDDIEFIDAQGASRQEVERNREDIDNILSFGLTRNDISLLKHIPVTHVLTPTTTLVQLYAVVTDTAFARLDSVSKYQALAWQQTAIERNLRNEYRVLYRVLLSKVDDEAFTRGYILHTVDGQPSLNEDFSTDYRTETFRDDTYVYFVSERYSVHVKNDGTGYDHSWRFQDYSLTVSIDADHLADAVVTRLLPTPTIGNKGKFTAIKNDGTGWEVVDPPSGSGGVTKVGTYTIPTSIAANTRQDTGLSVPSNSTMFGIGFEGVDSTYSDWGAMWFDAARFRSFSTSADFGRMNTRPGNQSKNVAIRRTGTANIAIGAVGSSKFTHNRDNNFKIVVWAM